MQTFFQQKENLADAKLSFPLENQFHSITGTIWMQCLPILQHPQG
jgi:hypothetical protein